MGRGGLLGKKSIADNPLLVKEYDFEKNEKEPAKIAAYSHAKFWWRCSKGHSWEAKPTNRSRGDKCPFCAGKFVWPGETDLQTLRPDLAKEWDYDKNSIDPSIIAVKSNRMVWWKCIHGHSWKAPVYSRSSGYGCPFCAGKRAISGQTDLATTNPHLLCEWDYEKNADGPESFTQYSHKMIWWKCLKGHSWQAPCYNRVKGNGCPYCAGKKAIFGETDLPTVCPELMKEWDYEKNEIDPTTLTKYSNKNAWWLCSEGHSWQASCNYRNQGNGCPFCTGKRAIPGETDLPTTIPELMKEWDYKKNSTDPKTLKKASNKKIWWRCSKGHSWQAQVSCRARGTGCPYCAGKKAIPGETDLPTVCPNLMDEWDYVKNTVNPKTLTRASNKKIWWLCSKGHSWQAACGSRSKRNGTGCPYCSGRLAIIGQTDLPTTNPELMSEWDYEKNRINPISVTEHSSKKVWWRCINDHHWRSDIDSRSRGSGCPYCRK